MLTGPNRPDGSSGVSALYVFQVEKVYLVVASGCLSPTSRLTHELITFTETSFAPGLSAPVASTRYGACQTVPRSFPFTVTTAMFFTSPRSIHTLAPFLNQPAGACNVLV